MSREQNVPLLLWISTALLAHIATGGGADRLARIFEDRADLHRFADGIRSQLQGDDKTFEITFVEDGPTKPSEPPPNPEAPKPAEKPEPKQAEAPKPKDEPEKAEAKVTPPKQAKPEPAKAPSPSQPPPPPPDRRIAVRQHAKPDQDDNPNAQFIADEANKVEAESVAEITSRDQDDPSPTPGLQHSGPSERPGNSDEQRVADSEERAGDPSRAPGENSNAAPLEPNELPKTAKRDGQTSPTPKPAAAPPSPQNPKVATPSPPPPPAGGLGPASPEVVAQEKTGGYRLDPARPGRDGESAKPGAGPGKLPSPDAPTGSRLSVLGLGAAASTPNGINLNLTERGVVAAVGEDALSRERRADGERRRSAHRGSWQASQFERWRAAIENYVSSVKPGNQTALNTARVPFATYLNTIHNRIHPIFADDFLGSLDGLPPNHPLNEPKLITRLEIVLDRDDGHVVKMGVLRTSGVTAFDVAALDSVQRGSPYGKPPSAIVSPDGNVYFHWEFHRNPMYACSTMHARPYLLNTPAPEGPGPQKPAPVIVPGDPREQGVPQPAAPSREGSLHDPSLPSPALARSNKRT